MKKYKVRMELEGKTLSEFFEFYHLGIHKANDLIQRKKVLVNNKIATNETILAKNQIVSIEIAEKIDYALSWREVEVVFEDDYFLIINKKPNIIIHSDSKDNTDSLCSDVASYFEQNGIDAKVRFAHRLDQETSGLIIFTKDFLTESYMDYLVSEHILKRHYLCLVSGVLKKPGTIDKPIALDRHVNNKRRISPTGQKAITKYTPIKSFKEYSLVECILETGRTHQIRLHMSSTGHSLLGDTLYGGTKDLIDRVALHSSGIEFIHPFTSEKIDISLEMPSDMLEVLGKK